VKYLPRLFSPAVVFSAAILIYSSPWAHGGVNDNATLLLDFSTTAEDTQTVTVAETSPTYYTVQVNGETRTRFNATLVLKKATNLTGITCDLVFDKTKLRVADIHEEQGDMNFDGRSNIADVLTLAERYGASTLNNELAFYDLDPSGASQNKIDIQDINAVLPLVNQNTIYWSSNPNVSRPGDPLRESVEIFESPDVSNEKGRIEEIVAVLLSRVHPIPEGFGFDGDARIADITFEIVGNSTGETTITFENVMAIDEATVITQTEIINASTPGSPGVVITLP